jgi:radical SAM protein with 4Fe4S-binding SPASM domain
MGKRTGYHEQGILTATKNKLKAIGPRPKYLAYRAKWKLASKYPIKFKAPIHVDVELTSNCNMRCTMCPHGIEGASDEFIKSFMNYDIAREVIKQCGEIGVSSIKFSGRGEAMMHPNFGELVKYAKSVGIIDVMFNTNGMLLKEDRMKDAVDAGIDLIIISMDGNSKETYENIRIRGDFDIVTNNINKLVEYRKQNNRKKPLIRLQFTIMQENAHEFQDFKNKWKDKVDILVGLNYSKRGEQETKFVDDGLETVGRAYCSEPWRRMMVTSHGDVLMCCADWYDKSPVGDINKESVLDIWNGEKINYAREAIKNLEHHKITACKECFIPETYKYKG